MSSKYFRFLGLDHNGPLLALAQVWEWRRRRYSPPVPQFIKKSVLARYGDLDGAWIETGTYRGTTTAWLSNRASQVVSIEASACFAALAERRFADTPNVRILHGSSDPLIGEALDSVTGNKLSVWLDGHYSGAATFQGELDSPLQFELQEISKFVQKFSNLVVFIDDFRLCPPVENGSGYPTPQDLISWATSLDMSWTVEYDIFVASKLETPEE